MHVVAGKLIGMQDVDVAALVIDLAGQAGEGCLHRRQKLPNAVRQKRRGQISRLGKIIDGSAVEENGGAVHGNGGGDGGKAGKRPTGGHGEDAALGHKILNGLPIFAGKRRQNAAA